MNNRMKFVIDAELCTGCRACELACSFAKEGVFAPSKARIKIVKMDEDGHDVPVGCLHCDPAPCMLACPTKALRRDAHGAVLLIDERCIGCRQCILACPFGAVQHDDRRGVYKCDLCDGAPECIKWCFTQALSMQHGNAPSKKKRFKTAEEYVKSYREKSRMGEARAP